MSLRPSELAQVVQELSLGLVGAGVQKIWAPSPQQLTLQLRQPGRSTLLHLSTQSGAARLSVLAAREEDPPSVSLQRFFRQELEGKELTSVRRLSARTVALTFRREGAVRELRADLGSGARIRLERDQDDGVFSSDPDPAPSRLQPAPGDDAFPLAHAAERLFQTSDDTARHAQLLRKVRSPLETQRKRLDRTLKKVTAEADREAQAEEHRRLGELLRHHAADVPRGTTRLLLQEYTAQGVKDVEVPLDPALGLREQTERHFHQYRRLLRGSAKARERLATLSQERARLDAALAQLETLSLDALQAQLPTHVPKGGGAPDPDRKPYREYRAWNGATVWVGRGGADNDSLTFKVARPEHWWLHARGVPGAHVVVPLQGALRGDAELPTELLLDAAHLAHHHSDHKGEPQGEVSYTRVKFVRKVKKGAPGQVTYTREKTFWLRVEPERLARLLRE